MANPGFRTSGGGPGNPGGAGGALPRSPFSQAQILHLMRTEFARARRYGLPLCCLMLHIDRLGSLTDRHGSELKSSLMRELGKLVGEKTRGADLVGLAGESSFLLLLPHSTEPQALIVAERIRKGFSSLHVDVDGVRLPVTVSLGVASSGDQDTLFFETLLSQAEVALEWATDAGGDQIATFRKDRFVRSARPPADEGDARP